MASWLSTLLKTQMQTGCCWWVLIKFSMKKKDDPEHVKALHCYCFPRPPQIVVASQNQYVQKGLSFFLGSTTFRFLHAKDGLNGYKTPLFNFTHRHGFSF